MQDQSVSVVPAGLEDADAVRKFLRYNYIQV